MTPENTAGPRGKTGNRMLTAKANVIIRYVIFKGTLYLWLKCHLLLENHARDLEGKHRNSFLQELFSSTVHKKKSYWDSAIT